MNSKVEVSLVCSLVNAVCALFAGSDGMVQVIFALFSVTCLIVFFIEDSLNSFPPEKY